MLLLERGFGDKMAKSQKHIFWQALLVTILIFSIGIIMGVVLENWRTSQIDFLAQKSEIDLLDIRLQSEVYSGESFNCESAIKENLNFADRIFEEAKILERYEKASRLTEDLIIQHKKYDILRATLLMNSIKIKEKCITDYHDVVYFYEYDEPSIEIKSKQSALSKLLLDLKEKRGDNILLIPMAGDNDLSSINLILDWYGVSPDELPIIVIDNSIKIKDIVKIEELEQIIDSGNSDNVIKL